MPTPKSIAEVIAAAVPALEDLRAALDDSRAALVAAKAKAPDLSGVIDDAIAELDAKIAVLDGATSADALAALGVTVLRELAALPSTGLSPQFHPGSVTGG